MGPRFGQATGRQGTAARSPHQRSVPGTPGTDRIRSKRLRRMWHIHHDAERGPPHRTTLLPGGAPAVDGPTSRDGQTRDRCARAATPRPSRPAARPPGAASQHRRCPDADADRREPRGRHPPRRPRGSRTSAPARTSPGPGGRPQLFVRQKQLTSPGHPRHRRRPRRPEPMAAPRARTPHPAPRSRTPATRQPYASRPPPSGGRRSVTPGVVGPGRARERIPQVTADGSGHT